MNDIPWSIWLLAALMAGALTVGMASAARLVFRTLSGPAGGWGGLAERYPALTPPAGIRVDRQSVRVGGVVYKNCVTATLAAEGLGLDAGWLLRRFGRRPMLIPWDQFRGEQPTTLHWQAAVRLQVGEPAAGTITIKGPLYAQLERLLRCAANRSDPHLAGV